MGAVSVGGLLMVILLGLGPSPAYSQADTTQTTQPDTSVAVPADTNGTVRDTVRRRPDTLRAERADTTTADTSRTKSSGPLRGRVLEFLDPTYGRTVVDSLPTLTPHVGLEHVLAQAPGSFLYDLGNVGWPHGWSRRGLAPNRSRLWIEGRPYNSPLTGRARYDLLPPSFLERPAVGIDPGGSPIGVHTTWRDYDQIRPITELRFRRDSNGLKAIEVGHSQQHELALFDRSGILQITGGYGGRSTAGPYDGTALRRERRIWGRLRYQTSEWAVELTDLSSRHRIGAHSGVLPPTQATFPSIYLLPACSSCSQNVGARRNTFRNDLTARVRAPLLPGLSPMDLSATWTSNTFDFRTAGDTTWTVRLNGGHASLQQPLSLGSHHLLVDARGSIWDTAETNVPEIGGARWSGHLSARDSIGVGPAAVVANAGWHVTSETQSPSAALRADAALGPADVSASVSLSNHHPAWVDERGFAGLVRPLPETAAASNQVLEAEASVGYTVDGLDLRLTGFAHRVDHATDLYAPTPPDSQRLASADTVFARQTASPVRRVGATVTAGVRRDASRGLYLTGRGTALTLLNDRASPLHTRLSRTLPSLYGSARLGARFVFFEDLITDLYLQVRGWSPLSGGWNSRWFHPPTGRFVVPPREVPLPVRPNRRLGANGTMDVHAEIKLRGATLFFTFENVQSSFAAPGSYQREATLQPGTFIVPIYPLPARQFRFGVHWPIFD